MIRRLWRCICRLADQQPQGPSPAELAAAGLILEEAGYQGEWWPGCTDR